MLTLPVDQLIPHIRRIHVIECSKCPRRCVMAEDVSTALLARFVHIAGWRVKDGKPVCFECAAL